MNLERLADLHEGSDAHATQQQNFGAEPLDIFGTPAAGVSNSTREASLKSRASRSFL